MSVSLFPVAAHGSHNRFDTSGTLSRMPALEAIVNMSLCKSARKLRGPLSYSFAQKISVINNNLTQLLFFNKIMKYYKSIFLGYMNSASLSTTMQNPQLKEFTN